MASLEEVLGAKVHGGRGAAVVVATGRGVAGGGRREKARAHETVGMVVTWLGAT